MSLDYTQHSKRAVGADTLKIALELSLFLKSLTGPLAGIFKLNPDDRIRFKKYLQILGNGKLHTNLKTFDTALQDYIQRFNNDPLRLTQQLQAMRRDAEGPIIRHLLARHEQLLNIHSGQVTMIIKARDVEERKAREVIERGIVEAEAWFRHDIWIIGQLGVPGTSWDALKAQIWTLSAAIQAHRVVLEKMLAKAEIPEIPDDDDLVGLLLFEWRSVWHSLPLQSKHALIKFKGFEDWRMITAQIDERIELENSLQDGIDFTTTYQNGEGRRFEKNALDRRFEKSGLDIDVGGTGEIIAIEPPVRGGLLCWICQLPQFCKWLYRKGCKQ